MSCLTDPASCPAAVVGGLARGAATSAWEAICKSFAEAAAQLLGAFAKAFVAIPPIDVSSGGVRSVYAISLGIAGVVAALLLVAQVIRTAVTHDGSALAHGLIGVGKAALAFMVTLAVAGTALRAADELTAFIVRQSFGSTKSLSTKIAAIVSWEANPKIAASLMLLLAVIGIVLTIVLWFEMLLRNAAIAVLVATSPIAASGQVSEATKDWWPRLVTAAIQLTILKPVVALVFALGFALTDAGGGVQGALTGMLILLLAVVAWPVIARFFTFTQVHAAGSAGLAAVLGLAAARSAGGGAQGGGAVGVAPDQFGQASEARTMAAVSSRTQQGGGLAAAMGPLVVAAQVGQRTVNALAGRMEQTAGHAGIPGANPYYAQPAGQPRYHGAARQPPGWPGGHPPPRSAPPPVHGGQSEIDPAGDLPVGQPASEPPPEPPPDPPRNEDGYR